MKLKLHLDQKGAKVNSQSVQKLIRSVVVLKVVAFSLSATLGFADDRDSYFHFSNGKKALFRVSDNQDDHGYDVYLEDPTTPIYHSESLLRKVEFHEDSKNSKKGLPKGIAAELTLTPATFTWFQDSKGKYLFFQDGTIQEVMAPDWKAVKARLVEEKELGEKYIAFSYATQTIRSTQLVRLSDSKTLELDKKYHPKLDVGGAFPNSIDSKRILSLNALPKVDLVTFEKLTQTQPINFSEGSSWRTPLNTDEDFPPLGRSRTFPTSTALVPYKGQGTHEITYAGETYQIKTDDSGNSILKGTFVVRTRDSLALKVDFKPAPSVRQGIVALTDDEDGILTIPGVSKRVDLKAFEAEVRRFSRLREAAPVLNTENRPVNAADEVAKYYKDLVQESRQDLERAKKDPIYVSQFMEKSDVSVIQNLAEAIRSRRSAVALGKAGTGKTAAIRAFARDIGQGLVPGIPRTVQIFKVEMASLSSGSKWVGTIQQRVATLVAAAQQTGCIFFVDELHSMAGIGTSSHEENDITQYIKGPMEFGDFILLGATTPLEFEKAFGGDVAFMQRFKQVEVAEPSGSDLREIIQARMKREIQKLPGEKANDPSEPVLTSGVLEDAIQFSGNYALTVSQPRAAVDLLRTAVAKMGNRGLEGKAPDTQALKEAALAEYKFDPANFDVALANKKLTQLEEGLDMELIGQQQAKAAVLSIWERKLLGVGDPEQVNSILFVGPPGVGKTKVAQASADLMGYEKTVIEMNKYHDGGVEDFRRAIYDEIKKHQFRVIILDEFEKADRSVQEAALSMLQTGEFTVEVKYGSGVSHNQVSAKHALFMLTSNAAGSVIQNESKIADKDLRSLCVLGGISGTVIDRLEYIVPMRNPNRVDFQKGIRFFIEKTLARESQKHNAHFILVKKATGLDSKKNDPAKDAAKIEEQTAKLQALIDPTTEKTEEQYVRDYDGFIDQYIQAYVESMSSNFSEKHQDDFRDVKRLMIKVEQKIGKALRSPDFEPGKWIFIQWDDSFIPEKAEAPKSDAYTT